MANLNYMQHGYQQGTLSFPYWGYPNASSNRFLLGIVLNALEITIFYQSEFRHNSFTWNMIRPSSYQMMIRGIGKEKKHRSHHHFVYKLILIKLYNDTIIIGLFFHSWAISLLLSLLVPAGFVWQRTTFSLPLFEKELQAIQPVIRNEVHVA